ncbi:hypothetical protein [Stigmatella erecta]|uniref:DUF4926 domain-containing protein n=1 Tax=Stigmatella erecta TaxID=83460 RepID=A0A1I0J9X1_9BACT|nr:hypothetical protein [Stigmatella erecta]SEU06753.1 hypothetical protein SAMN05443639_10789 [Stigmatella erecta]
MHFNANKGDRVCAASMITEENFMGRGRHVHARQGDLGVVQKVDGEWLTVTWVLTGTTYDSHISDLQASQAN